MFNPWVGPPEGARHKRAPYLSIGLLSFPRRRPRIYCAWKIRLNHKWRHFEIPTPLRRA